ncbi:hypothetical protein DFS34DRAFT_677671, partial [Phlyctochytrium arcticum]
NLATTYNPTDPVVVSECGYGCSDHASWNRAGYKAIMPAEGDFKDVTPFIHTAQDTFETLNFDHIRDFIQLGVAFTVELAASGNSSTPAPTTPGGGGSAPTGTAPAPRPTVPAPTPHRGPTAPAPTPKQSSPFQRKTAPKQKTPLQTPPPNQKHPLRPILPAMPAPAKKCAGTGGLMLVTV